jgi:mannitol-1-/sugar-/sorbitol-6-phosphatase
VSFAAVISDLDGVLVDSVASSSRAWAAWGARHGLDGAAIGNANHGRPTRDVLAEHVAPEWIDGEALFVLDLEVSDTRDVVPYAGAHDVLALPVVAIATSCTLPLAHARLRATGLPVPGVLVSADQVTRGKPAPDPYLLAAERLGVAPQDCLVLEDAPSGIAAARAAGMTVWAVTTTHAPAELTAAHRVAAGLPQLLADLADLHAVLSPANGGH